VDLKRLFVLADLKLLQGEVGPTKSGFVVGLKSRFEVTSDHAVLNRLCIALPEVDLKFALGLKFL